MTDCVLNCSLTLLPVFDSYNFKVFIFGACLSLLA